MVCGTIGSLLALSLVAVTGGAGPAPNGTKPPIRALIITGGHDYDREPFDAMWRELPGIVVQQVAHPNAHALWRPEAARQYDVIVLYDLPGEIGEQAKADLIALLKKGKGLVALHHSLAGYPAWDEYERILGGRFLLQKRTVGGAEQPASTWKDDVRYTVHIADPAHPVTRGLKDWTMVDETYGQFAVDPGVKVLLTTEEPTSGRVIGWAHTYGRARVVYLMNGHGRSAYEDPNYRRLLTQAVRWAARR